MLLAVNDFPPVVGGEATLYFGLARHLGAREALILAPRAEGDAEVDAALPVQVLRRWLPAHGGEFRRAARALLGGLHLAVILARRRFDYLVCGQLLSIGAPMALLGRLIRIRYAVFVHGADLADYAHRRPWGRLARWVVAGAHTVIVNSRFTASLIHRLLPGAARRIVVLPMGVDPAPPADPGQVESLRRRYGLGAGPVLLSVSRLVPMKGHDVVIEAMPRLLVRFPDLAYLVVGDGGNLSALRTLARQRGVAGRVVFAGSVRAPELGAHYRLATLFVQLSRATGSYDGLEGFGLSYLEAASHGLPCIAGRSGGVPEAIDEGESGLLLPPGDSAAFAAAVERLLADPATLRRLSQGALQWAASHPWEASARCLCSLANGD